MADFKISVDLSPLLDAIDHVVDGVILPRLSQAVLAVAQQASIDWKEGVARAKLWDGEKKSYMQSITWTRTGQFSAVVSSDYRYADDIETGRPARDLKKMLDTSMKVRTSKKGVRYMIIPFRHGTPGSNNNPMPKETYKESRMLPASRVTSMGRRISGLHAVDRHTRKLLTVAQRNYSWGGRLQSPSKNHNGMVRFDTSSGKAKSSLYLTFRVMSEKSTGWIIPAQPGQHIIKAVVDRLQPLAEKAFKQAITLDLG